MIEKTLFARHVDDDEEVIDIVHKHWILGLKTLMVPILSFVASLVLIYLAPLKGVIVVCGIWALVSLVWLIRNFFDYYLDAWIITDQGVIDLAWHGWFHRQSTRVLYSDVQGVSYEIVGVLGTILRYGTVSIEKISTGSVVSITDVPRPRHIESTVLHAMELYLHGKNLKDAKHVQELLSTLVASQMQAEEFEDEDEENDDEDT